jgi:hypothetical protein
LRYEHQQDRMRLHRARRRQGHIMVTIRLTDREILGLAERGYGGGDYITLADAAEAFICDALAEPQSAQ